MMALVIKTTISSLWTLLCFHFNTGEHDDYNDDDKVDDDTDYDDDDGFGDQDNHR